MECGVQTAQMRAQVWCLLLAFYATGFHAAAERPNFIFLIVDDVSWDDLGCYRVTASGAPREPRQGHVNVARTRERDARGGNTIPKTPHLDRMAEEGLRFTNAYLTISSCSPSRCSIITGRYPHNTGAAELHTDLPEGQFTFPEALREAGYYTALSGKHHMGPAVDPGFDLISKGKGPGKEGDWVDILRERPKDKPFFFWFASSDAHRKWDISDDAPVYDPDEIEVPPFLVDNPATREDLAQYYHEVSRTDTFVGKLRAELDRQGIAGDTCFIYIADNGRPFPRCKTRVYDSGVKTPLIMAHPGVISPAVVSSFVSSIDIAPTILELAGLDKDPRVQGVSLAPILEDPKAVVRDYVFAEHNWHVFQAHERMVRHGDWVYIRNAWPERQNLCMEADATFPAGEELWKAEAAGTLRPEQRDIFLKPRPAEELYRVTRDPHQFANLAENPEQRDVLEKLRGILDRWTEETGDTVPEEPTNDRQDVHGNKYPGHKRGTMPGAERGATKINRPGPVRAEE